MNAHRRPAHRPQPARPAPGATCCSRCPASCWCSPSLVRALAGQDDDITVGILGGFALATMVPLIGLIAGTGAIGPEIDDGSIVYLLAKPVSRPTIISPS